MIKAFISYSSKDSKFADRLAKDLRNLGTNIFYAKWNIKVGDSIVEKINSALSSHDLVVVILSKSSVKSQWVRKEINSTLMNQLSEKGIRILPILIESCEIPFLLSDIKYANFVSGYKEGFADLLQAFEEYIDLSNYLEIVKNACPDIDVEDKQKEIAICLKMIDPIPFLKSSVLSCVCEHSVISQDEILERFDNREVILEELNTLREDGLLEIIEEGEVRYYKIKQIGSDLFKCLIYGFNRGLLGPTCSH